MGSIPTWPTIFTNMKYCPKCNSTHEKSGLFCSRSCANSRSWTEEQNKSRSDKLTGRNTAAKNTDWDKWRESIKKSYLQKYNETAFENLGCENKRRRVFEEQNYCCAKCGLSEWLSLPITLELEHKDGNNQNNSRDNLEGLCPNCHSITKTWRGRNKRKAEFDRSLVRSSSIITDDFLFECLKETKSIRQGLLKAGLSPRGNNYLRAKKLLNKEQL